MTVAELIVLLQAAPDQTAQVIVYTQISEDADYAHGVMFDESDNHGERPYVKGDWPDYGETGPVAIIK